MAISELGGTGMELLRTLAEAENDVANGRVALMQDTFDDIRKSLLERKLNEAYQILR